MPGIVAMAATDGGELYEDACGLRNLADGPAMTPDTVFRIASMTKAITSIAAMQLVEQGKLAARRAGRRGICPNWQRRRCWRASTPPARPACARRSGRSRCATC